ncbi:MAG: hypothetical protein ABI337_10005 [Nitrososphaera sp.]
MVLEAPVKNTTLDCSRYGHVVSKTLAVRTHAGNKCGMVLNSDHKDTVNILNGFKIFGMNRCLSGESRKVTPVEIVVRSSRKRP